MKKRVYYIYAFGKDERKVEKLLNSLKERGKIRYSKDKIIAKPDSAIKYTISGEDYEEYINNYLKKDLA